MALALVTTLAAENANSYVDVEYADSYWLDHYQTTKANQWAALSEAQKTSALISACRQIEGLRFTYPYNPSSSSSGYEYDRGSGLVIELIDRSQPIKSSYFQALQFPRVLDRDKEDGSFFVPEPVKEAQCEQAVYLLTFDESAIATRLQGIESESITVGPISTSQRFGGVGTALAPMAIERLKPYLISSSKKVRRG